MVPCAATMYVCGIESEALRKQNRYRPKVIKLFSCSAQLRLKFILLINVKKQTIVGILTFISRIINSFGDLPVYLKFQFIWAILLFMSSLNFMLS